MQTMFNTQLLQNLQKYTRAPITPHYQNNAKNWDWGRIEEEAHTVCDQGSNVLLTADGGARFHVLIRLVCDITCNTISNIMLGLKKDHNMRTHVFHITRCLHHEQHWSSSTESLINTQTSGQVGHSSSDRAHGKVSQRTFYLRRSWCLVRLPNTFPLSGQEPTSLAWFSCINT